MIKPVYFAKLFNWTAAVIFIVITTVIGYVLVFVGAVVWNRLHRQVIDCPRPRFPVRCNRLSRLFQRSAIQIVHFSESDSHGVVHAAYDRCVATG